MTIYLPFPNTIKLDTIQGIVSQLWELPETIVELDFSSVRFAEPYGILLLAETLRRVPELTRNERPYKLIREEDIINANTGALSYLKHIGFFRYWGCLVGNEPNKHFGNNNYLPITIINSNDLQGDFLAQQMVDDYCDRLASILYSDNDAIESKIMLKYCLREIVRNCFEHGDASESILMAQRWSSGRLEVAVIDRGQGIPESLREKHTFPSQDQAILYSLLPGVSRKNTYLEQGEWGNSGFGLYIISELGKAFGNFTICSNGTIIDLRKQQVNVMEMPYYGTAIRLRLDSIDAEYFPNILQGLVTRGEQEIKERIGVDQKASRKSQTI